MLLLFELLVEDGVYKLLLITDLWTFHLSLYTPTFSKKNKNRHHIQSMGAWCAVLGSQNQQLIHIMSAEQVSKTFIRALGVSRGDNAGDYNPH